MKIYSFGRTGTYSLALAVASLTTVAHAQQTERGAILEEVIVCTTHDSVYRLLE